MQKILPVICLIACVSASASAAPSTDSASNTVVSVVNIQAGAVNNNATGGRWLPWIDDGGPTSVMRKYYTRDFVEIWKCAASNREKAWEGDFISGVQHISNERLMLVQPVDVGQNTALINVSIEDERGGVKGIGHVQFSLQREADAWKVNDVIELDYITHNQKNQSLYMEPSQRKALENYPCE